MGHKEQYFHVVDQAFLMKAGVGIWIIRSSISMFQIRYL